MDKPTSYCEFANRLDTHHVHRIYHDTAYGFPVYNDNELFQRLILEINQAGLSWNTILNKQKNFQKAYHHFDIHQVAHYTQKDKQRLLNDAGIIRNRLKIEAAIYNAQAIQSIQKECGSFLQFLNDHHPKTKLEWVQLFKTKFKFMGGEIVNEFLMSIGYLQGAHLPTCPMYSKILASQPAWLQSSNNDISQ